MNRYKKYLIEKVGINYKTCDPFSVKMKCLAGKPFIFITYDGCQYKKMVNNINNSLTYSLSRSGSLMKAEKSIINVYTKRNNFINSIYNSRYDENMHNEMLKWRLRIQNPKKYSKKTNKSEMHPF